VEKSKHAGFRVAEQFFQMRAQNLWHCRRILIRSGLNVVTRRRTLLTGASQEDCPSGRELHWVYTSERPKLKSAGKSVARSTENKSSTPTRLFVVLSHEDVSGENDEVAHGKCRVDADHYPRDPCPFRKLHSRVAVMQA
jgi:hypothetical protein